MCDIWKNKMTKELTPSEYSSLPDYLEDINITGGEPFLRLDFPEVISSIKKACPKARFVTNTNGFMWRKIKEDMEKVIEIDPKFAVRLSIDAVGELHDKIRGIPGGYKLIMKTLKHLRKLHVADLGVSFTLMNENVDELPKMIKFCKNEGLQLSLTVATESPIYFGSDKKEKFRPKTDKRVHKNLTEAANEHYKQFHPKEVLRGWFVSRMLKYLKTEKRALLCDAGEGFFYMDSHGNVYTCHLKPWIMGNVRSKPFEKIIQNQTHAKKVKACHDCWMICTAKSMMRKKLVTVALEGMNDKLFNTSH